MLDESLTLVVDRCAAPYMVLRGGGGGGWQVVGGLVVGELVKLNAHTFFAVKIVALVLHHRNPGTTPER